MGALRRLAQNLGLATEPTAGGGQQACGSPGDITGAGSRGSGSTRHASHVDEPDRIRLTSRVFT